MLCFNLIPLQIRLLMLNKAKLSPDRYMICSFFASADYVTLNSLLLRALTVLSHLAQPKVGTTNAALNILGDGSAAFLEVQH